MDEELRMERSRKEGRKEGCEDECEQRRRRWRQEEEEEASISIRGLSGQVDGGVHTHTHTRRECDPVSPQQFQAALF